MSEEDTPSRIECPYCRLKGVKSQMVEVPGSIRCDVCQTSIPVNNDDPIRTWLFTAEEFMRSPKGVAFSPLPIANTLQDYSPLWHDAWVCLALRRFNASIILMGTSMEATLQEVLRVHRNEHFQGTMGSLIHYLQSENLIESRLLDYAQLFTEGVRNRWQHQKESEITKGRGTHAVTINFGKDKRQGAKKIFETTRSVASGETPMKWMSAESNPVIRMLTKSALDEGLAYPLFNQVWTWTMLVDSRYLRAQHYEEGRNKFDVSNPVIVAWKDGRRKVKKNWPEGPSPEDVVGFPVSDRLYGPGLAYGR